MSVRYLRFLSFDEGMPPTRRAHAARPALAAAHWERREGEVLRASSSSFRLSGDAAPAAASFVLKMAAFTPSDDAARTFGALVGRVRAELELPSAMTPKVALESAERELGLESTGTMRERAHRAARELGLLTFDEERAASKPAGAAPASTGTRAVVGRLAEQTLEDARSSPEVAERAADDDEPPPPPLLGPVTSSSHSVSRDGARALPANELLSFVRPCRVLFSFGTADGGLDLALGLRQALLDDTGWAEDAAYIDCVALRERHDTVETRLELPTGRTIHKVTNPHWAEFYYAAMLVTRVVVIVLDSAWQTSR